jgi:aminoglycoside 6'-N-acetyltransferase
MKVSFRPLTVADLGLLGSWLGEEHVERWWKESSAPAEVRKRYLPCISGEDRTEVFVILVDEREVGMIQRYRTVDHPAWNVTLGHAYPVSGAAACVDYLIGDPALVGQGIGSMAVGRFSLLVFDAYPEVEQIVVTPQAANRASWGVLEKVGYRRVWTGMLDSDDPADAGPAAMYVLDRETVTSEPTTG